VSQQKRVLILTSKTGGGHVSLARALSDLLTSSDQPQAIDPSFISIVDPQPVIFHQHYRLVSRYALWLWAAEFRFLDTHARSLYAHEVFTRIMRQRLQTLLNSVQPELIIATYPFLTYEVMRILEQNSSTIPLVLLFSDANSVHASWLTERHASVTLATTRETYLQALAAGFAPEHLHLVGWPVRTQFLKSGLSNPEHVKEVRNRLHLSPDRFTIFVQGGGEGAARVAYTVENILSTGNIKHEVQIILAAGTNQKLRVRYHHVPDVATLPYTNNIAPYMAAADIIMGKAGPNILFESIMLGKPFFATAYIPGQEQENLAFIERHGLGWVALQPWEQRTLLLQLLQEPTYLTSISPTINAYRDWNYTSIKKIPHLIHQLIT
jgi:UDP-N-acetylglucosamine:LPS N-acetylglucosamine transferase